MTKPIQTRLVIYLCCHFSLIFGFQQLKNHLNANLFSFPVQFNCCVSVFSTHVVITNKMKFQNNKYNVMITVSLDRVIFFEVKYRELYMTIQKWINLEWGLLAIGEKAYIKILLTSLRLFYWTEINLFYFILTKVDFILRVNYIIES